MKVSIEFSRVINAMEKRKTQKKKSVYYLIEYFFIL